MQNIYAHFKDIVLWIGAIDALILLIFGLAAAIIVLTGKAAQEFYDRVVPAVLIYLGTSVAALVVMLVSRWLSTFFT